MSNTLAHNGRTAPLSAVPVTPPALTGRPPLARGEDGWLERVELITPAMCGPNALFMGQLGDWTWDAVGASCDIDPYTAADPEGRPVYLSFAYFRVRASQGLCTEDLTFGDRLRIRSKVLSCGGDSVLTLHRVGREQQRHPGGTGPGRVPGTEEFFRAGTDGAIHVENYNRWIQRSGHDTNHGLRRATPVGFSPDHLDPVPDRYTPRRICAQARSAAGFREPGDPPARAGLALTYRVSASRDLNGAGLLYFASYFSIVDWAALRLWRMLGRTPADFLGRRVLDRQLCYMANANADDLLAVEVTAHQDPEGLDVVDTTIRHQDGTLVAVARQRIRHVPDAAGAGRAGEPGLSPPQVAC